ncbi:hybrid sensor histidine kinase/response regulator [Saccharospirillum salsuginis]|uniref:histidine kinase n=1 Tax=Saccharospirillum salsuginis TaxID=418750 RepID=A0A918K3P8_9GAMM|nr:ATP-binding protein [Saccharospirillum salsuginis]GGX43863.1 hybrid sensor histidine kinase/response regulator [Saccharospirillum salsuginis]
MSASQKIFKVRRHYNKWVADQTLEDYALRFTAHSGRRMSIERVGHTALGATAFLALEGIAAAVTLNYGFINTVSAMLVVCLLFFITGFPITYYSAKHGLDIDLLTRGAGFGYLGSTLTSLIYASFTFIFFAIEAAILASALKALLGIPLPLGYFLCAVAVIPIVTHGIKAISRFQAGTQWLWLLLQCSALVVVVVHDYQQIPDWTQYAPAKTPGSDHFDLVLFGAAASVFFALVAQIGEQVDYLRFMPQKTKANARRWWFWLILAGPGWVLFGLIKMLLGSFLAFLAIRNGLPAEQASDPTQMYRTVFLYLTQTPALALILAALMVIVSQMKINVTNAYAGSIAWSNFFSRLTHSHPGRVVWLVFNVTIALILMELGIYQSLEAILGVFAIVAVSWLCSLSADLLINKPLGLSPSYVEFKRAHLYDINPVGLGSMMLATTLGMLSYLGAFGETLSHLAHFVSLATCFISVPALAWLTRGRFYLARQSPELIPMDREAESPGRYTTLTCGLCENDFEVEDISYCSAYELPICSLCCSLDVRCLDSCKPKARLSRQLFDGLSLVLPKRAVRWVNSRLGRFVALLLLINVLLAALLAVIYRQLVPDDLAGTLLLQQTLWTLFFTLLIVSGVIAWLFLLAHESRVVAQKESNRQTQKLTQEIEAHHATDQALQRAKELAERANAAKSRYLTGLSHELRTPLQSILGYAQLLSDRPDTPERHRHGLSIIHRSGQYLTDLIEGLLDVSKIEAGRLDLYRNRVDLPELIDQLANMFAMQARDKGIQCHCTIHDPLPREVNTDEKRLRQILINLLSNAIKYTAEGEVHLDIRYRNQVAEFTIRDSGAGIPPDALERIFDPFERVRNADTPNVPGTGLGLTIVKLLTEIMGGHLDVTSDLGHGSCFTVSLMLPWVTDAAPKPIRPQRVVGYEGRPLTLCLVDDDPVLRGLLSDLLIPLGFTTLEAHDAQTCLAMLDRVTPDLFLLDISMPGMNGLELARTLRQSDNERIRSAPIVMLSADAQDHQRDPNAQADYNGYLIKPVGNLPLLDQLAQHLRISWIYQDDAPNPPNTVGLANTPTLSIPDHPLIHELKACADIGYTRGVRTALERLTDSSVLSDATLNHLTTLSQSLQFEQLAQSLEVEPS